MWHTGKAALAASSPGTSGLGDSTSQLTSHPLEAQSGSRCTKLGGQRITPMEPYTWVWVCLILSDCYCRCPRGVIENRPPSGPRGACAPPERCFDPAVFLVGAEPGEESCLPAVVGSCGRHRPRRPRVPRCSFLDTRLFQGVCTSGGVCCSVPRYAGIYTHTCAHTHGHSHAEPFPLSYTPCAKRAESKRSCFSRLLCPRLPSHTTRLLFSMVCPLWGPWDSVLVIRLHLCPPWVCQRYSKHFQIR